MMNKKEMEKRVSKYMDSWNSKDPAKVLKFFAAKSNFVDPANPNGISNKKDLEKYIVPLMKKNSEWNWEIQELIPSKNGCIVKSKAVIPCGKKKAEVACVDILEFKGQKIVRNEVFFDQPKGYKVK